MILPNFLGSTADPILNLFHDSQFEQQQYSERILSILGVNKDQKICN